MWEKAGISGEGNNELEQSNEHGTFEHTERSAHEGVEGQDWAYGVDLDEWFTAFEP